MTRSILGLVPARGGSKGLPGKNVVAVAGKPLIAWTLEAAEKSGVFDAVVVSTDDPRISAVVTKLGAEVVQRPADLAGDTSPVADAVVHALDVLAAEGRTFTHVMLLQPTSPLRSADDIRAAVALLDETGGNAVVSVTLDAHSPLLSNTLPPDGSMEHFLRPEVTSSNRQELPEYFRLNGAIYLADAEWYRQTRSFIGPGSFALAMPEERSVDVDTAIDLAFADVLLRDSGAAGA